MANEFQAYSLLLDWTASRKLSYFCKSLGIHFQEPKYIDITVDAGII